MTCTGSACTLSQSCWQASRASNGAFFCTVALMSSRASSASHACLTRLSLMPSFADVQHRIERVCHGAKRRALFCRHIDLRHSTKSNSMSPMMTASPSFAPMSRRRSIAPNLRSVRWIVVERLLVCEVHRADQPVHRAAGEHERAVDALDLKALVGSRKLDLLLVEGLRRRRDRSIPTAA